MVKILTKPNWRMNSGAKLCSFSLHKEVLGNIKTKVLHERDFNYVTKLIGEAGENLGRDHFYMSPKEHLMVDFDMKTEDKYRGKYRLGELLRLISIMQMIENNIKKVELYSRENAVIFHAKYGFKSNIRRFFHRDSILEQIIHDKRFEDLSQRAKYIQERIAKDGDNFIQEAFQRTSILTDDYIQRIKNLPQAESNSFKHGFDMKLEKKFILENKAKFNEMFIRQGLDYQI